MLKIYAPEFNIINNSSIVDAIEINGIDYNIKPYQIDLISGNISRLNKNKILKPMFNTGSMKIPYVNLKTVEEKTVRVNYYKLLTVLRIAIGLIERVDYQFIINKSGNYLDGHIDNLLYLNGLESVYYRDSSKFNNYITNRVCIVDPTYSIFEAIEDGLVPMKPLNIEMNYEGEYHIDTDGVIVNNNTGKFIKKYISGLGYISLTYTTGNTKHAKNVINLLGRTFLNGDSNTVYSFKDSDIPRSNTELINIIPTTRNELTKKYHKNNTDHYDKYLKNHRIGNSIKVYINGLLYNSIKEGASYIVKEEEKLGRIRVLSSVSSLIGMRLNGKLKKNDKKIYNRYEVSKGG